MKVEPAWSQVATTKGVANTLDRKPDYSKDHMTRLVEPTTVDLRAARTDHKPLPLMSRINNSLGLTSVNNPTSDNRAQENRTKNKYSPSDIPRLREQWFDKTSDLTGPIPLELPPFREVNHWIRLMDENIRYNYHMP